MTKEVTSKEDVTTSQARCLNVVKTCRVEIEKDGALNLEQVETKE